MTRMTLPPVMDFRQVSPSRKKRVMYRLVWIKTTSFQPKNHGVPHLL